MGLLTIHNGVCMNLFELDAWIERGLDKAVVYVLVGSG